MLFELMKNAAYSTVERHGAEEAKNHPVQLTFVAGARDILVRVSDKGTRARKLLNFYQD